MHKSQAKTLIRGPPGSTIIIYKEIIRFNHLTRGPLRFPPTTGFSRRGLPPPLRGGNSWCKESPALPIPSYPALCREDTTSWSHGRPRTQYQSRRTPSEPRSTQESPSEPRRIQEQSQPWRAQRAQESPGEHRRAQESSGEPRRAQEGWVAG